MRCIPKWGAVHRLFRNVGIIGEVAVWRIQYAQGVPTPAMPVWISFEANWCVRWPRRQLPFYGKKEDLFSVRFGGKQPFPQEFGGIPSGDESHEENDESHDNRVEELEPYGIGVGNEYTFGTT